MKQMAEGRGQMAEGRTPRAAFCVSAIRPLPSAIRREGV